MLRFTMIAILDMRHDITGREIRVECFFLRRCVGGPA
jgi:hypothetical protein